MVSATPTSPHNKLYISSRILQVVLGITCFAIATHLKVDEWRWGYACDEQKGGCNSQEMWENYSGPGVVTINENSYSYIGPIGGAPGDRWDAVPNESQLAALIAAGAISAITAIASLATHKLSAAKITKGMSIFMLWDIVVALLCVGAAGAVGKYLSVLKVWTYTTNIAHLYRTTFVTSFLLFLLLGGTAVHASFLRKRRVPTRTWIAHEKLRTEGSPNGA